MIFLALLAFTCAMAKESWRYSTRRSEQDFTTRDPIYLDYFGQQDTNWCFGSGCSLTGTSSKTSLLHCKQAGLHAISPVKNASMVRYINVVHSPFCYEWYLAHHRIITDETTDTFRVWIVDPLHSSSEEENQTAVLPSSFSAQLSTIFNKFGQEPFINLRSGYRSIPSPINTISKGFNSNTSCWEFIMEEPIVDTQLTVWITGKSIAFHDCFIRDKRIQLLLPKYVFDFDDQIQKVRLIGEGQYPRVITSPCSPHIAAFISSSFVITQDNFKTTSQVYIPTGLLQGSEPVVVDTAFSTNGNLLLMLKSSIVLVYDTILQRFSKSSGLTSGTDSGLARILPSSTGCSSDTNHEIDTIAWSNSEGVFASSDGGNSFVKVSWPFSQSMLILEVVFHPFYQSYFFLVHDSNDSKNQLAVLEYIDGASLWRQHVLNFTKYTAETQSFTFLPKSSHFVLVWSAKAIFYGALNGEGALLDLRTRDGIRPFTVDATANISTVCTGWLEEFVVVLNDGRMFYGRSHLSYIVEIFPGEPDTIQISTMFDLTGQLILITNSSEGLGYRIFPLRNEVMSAMFPDVQCPYLELSSNIPPDVQYIDKGETKSFWVSLVHHLSSSNTVEHKPSSTSLVEVTMDEQSQYYPGMVMINKTFTFSKTKTDNKYTQNSTFGKGTMSVLFHPKITGLTCMDHYEKALLIKADCPPTRHLRIRNCTKAMAEVASKDFTNYHNMVQCELTSRVGSQMSLVLDMYDVNQRVMTITQDYILWEENNQKGFSYTATMAQAGCIKEAQNWAKMSIEETKNSSWHQNNYESCFEGEGSNFDGSKSYEILNSTGVSRVIFTASGPFAFTLKVIDPNVSFCTLTGRFTVMVSPAEDSKEFLPEIIAMCTVILISFGLLCASFWFYRRETLGEHEQDRQAAERLQQLRSIYKGVRMSVDETGAAAGGARHSIRRTSGAAALLMGLDNKKSSQAGTSLGTFIEEEDDED